MTYDFRNKLAGNVVPFEALRRVRNPHVIKIHGEKYGLSDDGGPLGSPEEHAELAGDARVILGPESGKFKYLWVLDTDRQLVVMWRAHDGNEKVWDRALGMQAKLVKLDKKSQLNRVDHETFVVIEREMQQAARENEQALKRYLAENESEQQKIVNKLVQRYFDEQVRPDIERAIAAVQAGAIPFGFKPSGSPEHRARQMAAKAMRVVMSRKFTEPLVERYVADHGVLLDGPGVDTQAVQWAVADVVQATYEKYLPERALEL